MRGLEGGADDYMVKPFAFSEFLARVQALLRRGRAQASVLRLAGLELDLARRRAQRDGRRLDLTAKEFNLLVLLLRRQVLSRTTLAEQVWDMNFDSDTNVIDVAVRRLRGKLDDPSTPSCFIPCAAWATCWSRAPNERPGRDRASSSESDPGPEPAPAGRTRSMQARLTLLLGAIALLVSSLAGATLFWRSSARSRARRSPKSPASSSSSSTWSTCSAARAAWTNWPPRWTTCARATATWASGSRTAAAARYGGEPPVILERLAGNEVELHAPDGSRMRGLRVALDERRRQAPSSPWPWAWAPARGCYTPTAQRCC